MNEKGQSLIEVMVALGVSVIVIATIVTAVVLAVINSQFAKTQNQATYYARQGIELVRQDVRADWSDFNTLYGTAEETITYCLTATESAELELKETECEVVDSFIREVEITSESDNCILEASDPDDPVKGTEVEVNVFWSDNKCDEDNMYCHSVSLNSCLQNINAVSAP